MKFPKSEFWNYSTQIWQLPNIESNCLELQNQYNVNVNVLLYCCWVGDKNLMMSTDNMQAVLKTAKPWQEIIEPLRESRKVMQQSLIAIPANELGPTLDNINEMEINTEHMAQRALEKALKLGTLKNSDNKTNIECSQSNIELYLSTLDNIAPHDEISSLISQILNTLFTDNKADAQAV